MRPFEENSSLFWLPADSDFLFVYQIVSVRHRCGRRYLAALIRPVEH
jgi:hypothetical protein